MPAQDTQLTLAEAARFLQTTEAEINQLVDIGKLFAVKIAPLGPDWRFLLTDLRKFWIAQHGE